jgi:hypothetical protein
MPLPSGMGCKMMAIACMLAAFVGAQEASTVPCCTKSVCCDGLPALVTADGAPVPWTVTSGGSACAVTAGREIGQWCVSDGGGNYGNSEDCTFRFTGAGTLTREIFHLEEGLGCRYDYLNVTTVIDGSPFMAKYCGDSNSPSAPPRETEVTADMTFSFHSDSSVNFDGFKICAIPTPPSRRRLTERSADLLLADLRAYADQFGPISQESFSDTFTFIAEQHRDRTMISRHGLGEVAGRLFQLLDSDGSSHVEVCELNRTALELRADGSSRSSSGSAGAVAALVAPGLVAAAHRPQARKLLTYFSRSFTSSSFFAR